MDVRFDISIAQSRQSAPGPFWSSARLFAMSTHFGSRLCEDVRDWRPDCVRSDTGEDLADWRGKISRIEPRGRWFE
jgi:hypothetical protein